MAKFSYLT
jgi:hypothetical protein